MPNALLSAALRVRLIFRVTVPSHFRSDLRHFQIVALGTSSS